MVSPCCDQRDKEPNKLPGLCIWHRLPTCVSSKIRRLQMLPVHVLPLERARPPGALHNLPKDVGLQLARAGMFPTPGPTERPARTLLAQQPPLHLLLPLWLPGRPAVRGGLVCSCSLFGRDRRAWLWQRRSLRRPPSWGRLLLWPARGGLAWGLLARWWLLCPRVQRQRADSNPVVIIVHQEVRSAAAKRRYEQYSFKSFKNLD